MMSASPISSASSRAARGTQRRCWRRSGSLEATGLSDPGSRAASAVPVSATGGLLLLVSDKVLRPLFTGPQRSHRRAPPRTNSRTGNAGSAAVHEQADRLGPGAVGFEERPADGGGHGLGAGLAHPAHGHAQVLGLDHDDNAARLKDL